MSMALFLGTRYRLTYYRSRLLTGVRWSFLHCPKERGTSLSANVGWTALIPGFGLLSDEFPQPALKIWELDKEGGFAYFDQEKDIKIPLRPFAGEMGVAPGRMGAFSTIPPYNTGGNIDTKHLSAGATLFLPVEVEGALFSIGGQSHFCQLRGIEPHLISDGHAAQGDGGEFIDTIYRCKMSVLKKAPFKRSAVSRTFRTYV